MTDWQRDLDDARATIEELTRERDEALNALMRIRVIAADDRGSPLIDRVLAIADQALALTPRDP